MFFGHPDEDLAWLTIGVESYSQVAFMPSDRKMTRDRRTLIGKTMAVGCRRPKEFRLLPICYIDGRA